MTTRSKAPEAPPTSRADRARGRASGAGAGVANLRELLSCEDADRRRIVDEMKLLCVLWSHRYATVANPGEEPYQWCQRCQHYRSTAYAPTGRRPRAGGDGTDHSGQGGDGGFVGGSDGGGGGPS